MLNDTRSHEAEQTDRGRQVAALAILGQVVTVANVLIAIVLIAGIYYDSRSATLAVLSGVAWIGMSTGFVVTVLSGALPDVIINAQNQETLRRRDELQYRDRNYVTVYEPPQIAATPADEHPAILPYTANYVPATPPPLPHTYHE